MKQKRLAHERGQSCSSHDQVSGVQKELIAFFGIRGIGSLYYLAFAVGNDLDDATTERLSGIVLTTIAISLMVHSNVSTPILDRYAKRSAN